MYKIYYLEYNNEVIYVGLTTQKLETRKSQGYKYIPYFKECKIVLIEETNDRARERFWISEYTKLGYNLINISKGEGINHKEYYKEWEKNNKDWIRKYRIENKDKVAIWNKTYNEKNKEKLKIKRQEYYRKKKQLLD